MESKYQIGQTVHAKRSPDFDFVGVILKSAYTGEEWEYEISNSPWIIYPYFPMLIWESEINVI